MGATIKVQVSGLPEVKQALADAAARVTGRDAMRVVAGAMLTKTLQRFKEGKAPDGTPWAPTSRGGTVLVDNGMRGGLLGSITSDYNEKEAIVGTDKEYAKIHQFGGDILPRPGKALAIPVSAQALKQSRLGLGPTEAFAEGALSIVWPKGKKGGWLVETKKGSKKQGIGAKTIFHYRLVGKVHMPARPFLGIGEGDKQEIVRRLAEFRAQA